MTRAQVFLSTTARYGWANKVYRGEGMEFMPSVMGALLQQGFVYHTMVFHYSSARAAAIERDNEELVGRLSCVAYRVETYRQWAFRLPMMRPGCSGVRCTQLRLSAALARRAC